MVTYILCMIRECPLEQKYTHLLLSSMYKSTNVPIQSICVCVIDLKY